MYKCKSPQVITAHLGMPQAKSWHHVNPWHHYKFAGCQCVQGMHNKHPLDLCGGNQIDGLSCRNSQSTNHHHHTFDLGTPSQTNMVQWALAHSSLQHQHHHQHHQPLFLPSPQPLHQHSSHHHCHEPHGSVTLFLGLQ